MAQRLAAAEHDVELLRKESLNSLSKAAARRVLELSYTAVLTMAPLPGPPLPLSGANGAQISMPLLVLLTHCPRCKACGDCALTRGPAA